MSLTYLTFPKCSSYTTAVNIQFCFVYFHDKTGGKYTHIVDSVFPEHAHCIYCLHKTNAILRHTLKKTIMCGVLCVALSIYKTYLHFLKSTNKTCISTVSVDNVHGSYTRGKTDFTAISYNVLTACTNPEQ